MSFVKQDERRILWKVYVVDCDEDSGKFLLKHAPECEEWMLPNLVQEALMNKGEPVKLVSVEINRDREHQELREAMKDRLFVRHMKAFMCEG